MKQCTFKPHVNTHIPTTLVTSSKERWVKEQVRLKAESQMQYCTFQPKLMS